MFHAFKRTRYRLTRYIFFLSGLGWHLPGLSEVPTWAPPPSITCWTFPAFLCFLHFFGTFVFSFSISYVFIYFSFFSLLQFLRAQGQQQQQHNQPQYSNNTITTAAGTYSSSSTSVSTRVRQRKQARMKEQVKCCREPAMYERLGFLFPHSFFLVPSSFILRKANRQQ